MFWCISFQSFFYVPQRCLKLNRRLREPVGAGADKTAAVIAHDGFLDLFSLLPTPKQLICWWHTYTLRNYILSYQGLVNFYPLSELMQSSLLSIFLPQGQYLLAVLLKHALNKLGAKRRCLMSAAAVSAAPEALLCHRPHHQVSDSCPEWTGGPWPSKGASCNLKVQGYC